MGRGVFSCAERNGKQLRMILLKVIIFLLGPDLTDSSVELKAQSSFYKIVEHVSQSLAQDWVK